MFIFPYNSGSGSVRALRGAVDGLRVIRRDNSRFRGSKNKVVINWGASKLPEEVMKCEVVNNPNAVSLAANKKAFFDAMKGQVNIPEYTSDKDVALGWIREGKTVLAREQLSGHSGAGIVILETEAQFDDYDHDEAKIYVQYIPKKDEFRIHVSNGEVIDQQRKAVPHHLAAEQVNFKIRSHANGFIFAREGVEPNEKVIEQAKLAVKLCGLDFGAVDVIWNNYRNEAYVLEINTAPGLEGTTLDKYSNNMKKFADLLRNNVADPEHLRLRRHPNPVEMAVDDIFEVVAFDDDGEDF